MLRSALFAALLLAVALLTGCKKPTSPAATAAPVADTANMSAVDLYNTKRYPDALRVAEADALTMKGRDKEVAQLTAGLSAYALNQSALAKHHLDSLTGSSDPQIAGRAEAVLGQIAEKAGNKQYAADLFKRASAHLEGDDSARAAVRAGNSLAKLNKPAEAQTQYRNAAKEADSLAIKQTATKLGQPGPFTIQVGAFTNRAGAEKKLAQMRPATIKAGMGSPRIVPDNINGKPGYSVQVGMFPTRVAAESGKTKLGGGQYLVVSAN
jgi:hypothetical protein